MGGETPRPSFFLRNAFMRRLFLPLIALGILGFGLYHLASGVVASYDAIRMRTAPECGTPQPGCFAEHGAIVVATEVEHVSRGEDEYYVVLNTELGRKRARVAPDEYELFVQGEIVTVRWYGETPIRLTTSKGRRVQTWDDPNFAWAEGLVMGFLFTSIGLMTAYGTLAAEERYGKSGFRLPSPLRPKFTHTLHTGSASGLHEYTLRQRIITRLVLASMFVAIFLIPNLWWTPPLWVNGLLLAAGVVAALPVLRRPAAVMRIGDNRIEFEGSGASVRATAWEPVVHDMYGNPTTYVELLDGEAQISTAARLFHATNAFFGEDVSERLSVQAFIEAANREEREVEEALLADLERGVRREATSAAAGR